MKIELLIVAISVLSIVIAAISVVCYAVGEKEGKRAALPREASHDVWAETMHKEYIARLEYLKNQTDFPADEKIVSQMLLLLIEMALRTSDYLMVTTNDINCLKRHAESVMHIRDGTAETLKPFRRDPTREPLWVIGIYDALRSMGVCKGKIVVGGYLVDFG